MMDMIDACAPLRRFSSVGQTQSHQPPRLRWVEGWMAAAGYGVVVGLIDTGCAPDLTDLVGADLTVRDFTHARQQHSKLIEHGTFSVATLIGQGHRYMRGIAPCIRLMVAAVVEPDGVARPQVVAEALDWLVAAGAQIVAIPLGDPVDRQEIISQLEQGASRSVAFFAAAGNCYPQTILFPARYSTAIAVGAAADDGTLLPTCNRLPRLDLVAPGQQITSLACNGVMQNRSGSSIACVIGAGVAALAVSATSIPGELHFPEDLLALIRVRDATRSAASVPILEDRCV